MFTLSRLIPTISTLFFLSGCAQTQLRKSTVFKAQSLTGIYEQQVLDNLAKFVADENALPHFAYPDQGTSAVNDSVNLNGGLQWNKSGFSAASLGSTGGSRAIQENWVLKPITDPRKLERMRCAYQKVVQCAGYGCGTSIDCPDCQSVFNKFHTGHDLGSVGTNTTSSACICESKWFCTGTKSDVPKDCGCLLVGNYCDQYVWVSGKETGALAKLTLLILDYALNDPPSSLTKEVTFYLNAKGEPTTLDGSVSQVTATVGVGELNESIIIEPWNRKIDELKRSGANQELLKALQEKKADYAATAFGEKVELESAGFSGLNPGNLGLREPNLKRYGATGGSLQNLGLRLEAAGF